MTSVTISRIDPAQARDLIRELDRYQEALYPPASNHLESEAQLSLSHVAMFGCRADSGGIIAIGAVKLMTDYGEIKRMYVPPAHRGKGLAKMIMAALESHIREEGRQLSRLETGIHQHEAINLYEKSGYTRCPPFGDYAADPLSVFMEKRLGM